jgi:hypothetical protein
MKLLTAILLMLGSRQGTVPADEFARVVEAEAAHSPKSPHEWARLLTAIAENESRLSERIADGKCGPYECDRGRAKGLWQLHANATNRSEWAQQDGNLELQAHLASDQLKRAYWTCHRSGVPWLQGTINAYAGRRCGDQWEGLQARIATYNRLSGSAK